MKKFGLFLLVFVFLYRAGISQTIKGVVVDNDGLAIPGASVTEKNSNKSTMTNLDGSFSLNVKEGKAHLVISMIGYVDYEKDLEVKSGETVDLGKISLIPDAIGLQEVKVVASFAVDRRTPVAVSKIDPVVISEKLGTQEFPAILKTTPSVYATKRGGGYGDGRINIRGFDSRNIGVLINGVPVNDMENGKVYWSNWANLADVTRTIQVQRGLGASRLAISSVGGTINIITRTTDVRKGGSIYYAIGHDHYMKQGFTISTGLTENGFAITMSGSHTTGDGYVKGTDFEAWSYFLSVAKRFSERHKLSFTMFGAPQWHNQRAYMRPIQEYRKSPDGIRMNWDFGYRHGKVYGGDYAFNQYHKPIMSINDFYKFNENLKTSIAIYASFGRGGGRRIYSNGQNQWLKFQYPSGMPGDETFRTPDGYLNFDTVMQMNAASLTGSKAIIAMARNEHDWYGSLGSIFWTPDKFNITAGYDVRYYRGYHYMSIEDLLGGSYFLNSSNINRDPGKPLFVGDTINYSSMGEVWWYGTFLQVEYTTDKFSAFVSGSNSLTKYRRTDYFKYTPGNQVSDIVSFFTYSVKGGFNYNISEKLNYFANGGYFTRPPFFKYAFKGYTNEINEGVKKEKVASFETGLGFRSKGIRANLYAYYTKWIDKTLTRRLGDTYANITGLNAVHKGIEFEGRYDLLKNLNLYTMVSIGDWRWEKDVIADIYDQDQNLIGTETVYAAGLHVSDAAQTTAAAGFDWEIAPKFKIGSDFTYYDRLYAAFDVENRTSEDDRGIDAWRMPAYSLLDLNLRYDFDLGKMKATLFGKINNVFDTEYISDALDGINHDALTSYVYYGFGRTWSVALKVKF